jgi:predicted nucleic acid-binding protein
VKVLLDTSVWVEHLRHGVLDDLLQPMRGRYLLRLDVIVAAELRAGCRSKKESALVDMLCAPHERADRLLCPARGDFQRAAAALARLRGRGRPGNGGKGALLDALVVAIAARETALLVTGNVKDFLPLVGLMPVEVEAFESFRRRLLSAP